MKDEQVKQKIESVDALASGIVYGKEAAWERLQARMDAPPVRIVPWRRYAMAAALLLCVCLVALYLYQDEQPEQKMAVTPVPTTPIPQQISIAPIDPLPAKQAVAAESTTRRYATRATPSAPEVIKSTPAPTPVEVVEDMPAPPVPIAHQTARKMRVVHLNDLDNTPEPADAMAYNGPALDISKMKVVSIYDVQREDQVRRKEEDVMTIVRQGRPHGILDVANRFARPRGGDTDPFANSPLSLRLNRKN